MFRADAETGKVKEDTEDGARPALREPAVHQFCRRWHPNGREFVFAGVSRGKPIITILDAERGKAEGIQGPEAGEIFNPPGRRMVVTSFTRRPSVVCWTCSFWRSRRVIVAG